MKKQLFLIGLILACFTGYSQNIDDEMVKSDTMVVDSICHSRVTLLFGGGFTNNYYNRFDGIKYDKIHPSVHSFELGYTYFFDRHWGLGLGVGIQRQSARANLNFQGVIPDAADQPYYNEYSQHYTNYDLLYHTKNLIERQTIWAIEVPLTAQFHHFFNEKHGLFASLGVRGYFPIYNRSKVVDGSLVTEGWDEYYHLFYTHEYCVNHGFDEYTIAGNGSAKLRCSVDLEANFGGLFRINNKVDFYVGLFCNYGFLDILPKPEDRHLYVEPTDNAYRFSYNGLLGSNADILYDQTVISNYHSDQDGYTNILREDVVGNFKWHNLQVGLKLGISISPCGKVDPSDRKKYLRTMTKAAQKYLDDTCSACDRNTEYIYIVPMCPETNEDGEELTPKQKQEVKDLADDLEKIKILFDLDKDVPKINESGDYIDKAAKKLNNNSNLILVIEGYTCKLGPEEHNRDLAKRRAESIKRLFVEEKGVSPDQLELHTYTNEDKENTENITDDSLEEHRAAIIRIKVRD